MAGAAQGLAYFHAAGFPNLHLNQVLWNTDVLPGEQVLRAPGEMLHALGFDSFNSYVWVHHAALDAFPETDFGNTFAQYMAYWEHKADKIDLPYFLIVSMGWDTSPRTVQSDGFANAGYPFTPPVRGGTPHAFGEALRAVRRKLAAALRGPPIIAINTWNEWTEESYLVPDTEYGM